MNRPISDWFDDYRKKILPPDITAKQLAATRNAFFAGATQLLSAILNPDKNDKKGMEKLISAAAAEVEEFCTDQIGDGHEKN